MVWPSSAPRPRISCAQSSLEISRRGKHFAHNMCRLRLRAPAFSGDKEAAFERHGRVVSVAPHMPEMEAEVAAVTLRRCHADLEIMSKLEITARGRVSSGCKSDTVLYDSSHARSTRLKQQYTP